MINLFIGLAWFIITLLAVWVWIGIVTGDWTFDVIGFISDALTSLFCIVWYLIKWIIVLIVNMATSILGLGNVLSQPTYNC